MALAQRQTARSPRWGIGGVATLVAVMMVAVAIRLHGVGFGLPALNDPDELIFELGALRMLRTLSLNPAWFGHPGTTTMEVLAVINATIYGVGRLIGWFASPAAFADIIYADPTWVILPGRMAMAAFGVGTVWQTYRLGSTVGGRGAGLAAAAMLAVEPASVAWSQVIRTDIMATFFLLLTLRSGLAAARYGRWRDYGLAGLWVGLATATKWPVGIAVLAIVGAGAAQAAGDSAQWSHAARRAIAGGAAAVVALLTVSPYLLLAYSTVVRNLQGEAQAYHLGATGGSPLANLWWYATGPVTGGIGAIGMALAAVGAVVLARRMAGAVILPPAIAMVAVICQQNLVWERWILPLMPILALMVGLGWATVFKGLRDLAQRPSRRPWPAHAPPVIAVGVLALALVQPILAAAARDTERLDDARQRASAWAARHIPAGSTVLVEHFAFDLLPHPWRILFPLGEKGCVDARAVLKGKVQYAAVDAERGGRSNLDYGTLIPARRDTCRADFAILTQYDRYAAERERFPREYAAYRALIATGRIVATFPTRPGRIGGYTTRIVAFSTGGGRPDHPPPARRAR